MYSDNYYKGLIRDYGSKNKKNYEPPKPFLLSDYKRNLLKKGLPLKLDIGIVDSNEFGELIITYNNGDKSFFIRCSDNINLID